MMQHSSMETKRIKKQEIQDEFGETNIKEFNEFGSSMANYQQQYQEACHHQYMIYITLHLMVRLINMCVLPFYKTIKGLFLFLLDLVLLLFIYLHIVSFVVHF